MTSSSEANSTESVNNGTTMDNNLRQSSSNFHRKQLHHRPTRQRTNRLPLSFHDQTAMLRFVRPVRLELPEPKKSHGAMDANLAIFGNLGLYADEWQNINVVCLSALGHQNVHVWYIKWWIVSNGCHIAESTWI
ncbi:hypothetical protein H0G86_013320 [Trichoderma simmonsii]|uniref:Uncharacterized protein n=1 Tax=Trichoderma simmonsii TaxID=1491479 RepID=A0A8G0L7H8_9HYPO|nr:hypothetical protein H0G86_013320 [Trichoderma simmonsii]